MISIKRFNESSKKQVSKQDIEDLFAHSFDLCEKYEIDIAYFDPDDEMSWASNDFSNERSDQHPNECYEGFQITFHHPFYDKCDILDFKNYLKILNEIDTDIERAKSLFNIQRLFFEDAGNSTITLLIL